MAQHRPTFGYSILSVALVLLLIGGFGFALLQARSLVQFFKEKVEMLVELHPETEEQQREVIMASISNQDWYKPNSLQYISKAQGAELLQEDFGTDFEELGFENPLFDVLQFNLKAEFIESKALDQIRNVLKGNELVHDVYYQNGIIDGISAKLNRIGWISMGVAILFLLVAITLIHNTIHLALESNRQVIRNMQLVGATWGFITGPYLWRSVKNGLLAAMLAISVLLVIILLASKEFPELNNWDNSSSFLMLFAGMMTLGLLINLVSTWYVIRTHLDMRMQ